MTTPTQSAPSVPDLMDIEETAVYLKERGIKRVSVPTLRKWRKTWPKGECKGPTPLLLDVRCLRYSPEDCDRFIEQYLEFARRRVVRGEAA